MGGGAEKWKVSVCRHREAHLPLPRQPRRAPLTGPPSAVESDLLRGLLGECEHCSCTSVFSRDANANRFWQDAGPLWRTKEQRENRPGPGRGGGKGAGNFRVGGECSQTFQQRPLSVDARLYGSKAHPKQKGSVFCQPV